MSTSSKTARRIIDKPLRQNEVAAVNPPLHPAAQAALPVSA
jgi:hypothetical protein